MTGKPRTKRKRLVDAFSLKNGYIIIFVYIKYYLLNITLIRTYFSHKTTVVFTCTRSFPFLLSCQTLTASSIRLILFYCTFVSHLKDDFLALQFVWHSFFILRLTYDRHACMHAILHHCHTIIYHSFASATA